jgi:hypothetical protein
VEPREEDLPSRILAGYRRQFPLYWWFIVAPAPAFVIWGDFAGVGSRTVLTSAVLAMLPFSGWVWAVQTREVAIGDHWLATQNVFRRRRWSVL